MTNEAATPEPVELSEALTELLQEETASVVAERDAAEWSSFSSSVMSRIEAVAAKPVALEGVSEALQQASSAALAEQDFGAFLEGVMARIETVALEEPEGHAEVSAALREASAAALAREDFGVFGAQVMARVEAEASLPDPEFRAVGDLLRSSSDEEVASRRPDWSSFSAGVMDRVAADARLEAKTPLDERAVDSLKSDVEHALDKAEPRFEREFESGVARKIEKGGPASWLDSLLERVRAVFETSPPRFAFATAGLAVAVAVLAVIVLPVPSDPPDPRPSLNPIAAGEVSVDEVSFEGAVTVLNAEGATVIWLARGPS